MKNHNITALFMIILTIAFESPSIIAGDELIFEKSVQTESGAQLRANTFAGNIKVITSQSNEVTVKVYGNDVTKSKVDFSAEKTDFGVSVDCKAKNPDKCNNCDLRMEITVPASYSVVLKTGGGNLSVASLSGKIEMKTNGGNISIESNSGDAEVTTLGGNVSLKGFNGNVSAETNGGNIKLSGSNGSVHAMTNGGNITLDYSGRNNGIELETSAGNIKVEIPSDFNADVNLSTTVGKIITDIGSANDKHIGSSLQSSLGSGGSKLTCETQAGTIIVNKK